MSTIRRQSIISSVIVYFGFALGLLNTYLFTRQGGFTEEQYGLTNTFIAIAAIMFSVAGLAMPAYISKFFPYYKSHLPDPENDQITWALILPCLGFGFVLFLGIAFKGILINRIFNNSPELLQYYYWTFPFGFGYTLFMVLEAYAWQHRKAVLSNLLKEVMFRLAVTILIVLTTIHLIRDFRIFIGIYSFLYLVLVAFLLAYFRKNKKLYFSFSRSQVTQKFYKKIKVLVSFVWSAGLVFTLASVFDGIVIVAVLPHGLREAGIFYLAQNISSLMQAPQRAVISAAVGPLSQAWREKDYGRINRIYHRSSINQLIFACALFCLIWMNFDDGVHTFHLKESYLSAKWIFFFLGLSKIIDMGTGLNAQIIGTSTYWRFEFFSGLILFAVTLPLTYELTRYMGPVGPAISNLVGMSIYNGIRYTFLLRKFKMQPFNGKSVLTLVLSAACYLVCYQLFGNQQGFLWMVIRSAVFCLLFATGMLGMKLSQDAIPVFQTMKRKLGMGS
jgi:O-antigen/teichoic acid export membrane protein